MASFSEIIHNTLHGKRWRVKAYVRVKSLFVRDSKGRFAGKRLRKGYTRRIYNRSVPMVTSMDLLGENITANNVLLARLKSAGNLK